MNRVQRQTHRGISPLLPEEIMIGSKEAALGMWGIPSVVFQTLWEKVELTSTLKEITGLR